VKKPPYSLISAAIGLLTLTSISGVGIAFAQDGTERVAMLSMDFLMFLGVMIMVGALSGAIFMFIAGAEFVRRRKKVRN
jgi:hypothetical protein